MLSRHNFEQEVSRIHFLGFVGLTNTLVKCFGDEEGGHVLNFLFSFRRDDKNFVKQSLGLLKFITSVRCLFGLRSGFVEEGVLSMKLHISSAAKLAAHHGAQHGSVLKPLAIHNCYNHITMTKEGHAHMVNPSRPETWK